MFEQIIPTIGQIYQHEFSKLFALMSSAKGAMSSFFMVLFT